MMPSILNTEVIDLDFKVSQSEVLDFTSTYFDNSGISPDIMKGVFENTGIKRRQFINTREWFYNKHTFLEKNDLYIKRALQLSSKLVRQYENLDYSEIDNIIFVSSTGLSTPSIDAYLINELEFNRNVTRTPIWGLGCVGGAVGLSRAYEYSLAYPDRLTLLIALEFCSLAFLNKDHSKSNFIAMALFSDGAASAIISGANHNIRGSIKILNTCSTLYNNSTDVMGWEFIDSGLKAVFSKDIPNIVRNRVSSEIQNFLIKNNIEKHDIKHFLIHPGGTKIINEFENCLGLDSDSTFYSRKVLEQYGNMSSPTIIYVINEFLRSGNYKQGELGLIASMGPGFSSELLLFQIQ